MAGRTQQPRVNIICALGRNRAIGRGNALPWRLPEDLRRFKRLTMGHPIVMGRKTFESIGRALPGRLNIVITRRPDYHAAGCRTVRSVADALRVAGEAEEAAGKVFVIGGGQIYARTLDRADRLYLTVVDDAPADADTFFPGFERDFRLEAEEAGGGEGPPHRYQTWVRHRP